MPKKCEHCNFFDPENGLTECPHCGEPLRFTMFTPPGFASEPDEFGGAQPWAEHLAPYEEMELPWSMRTAQISAGIGVYFLVSRTAANLLSGLFIFSSGTTDIQELLSLQLVLIAVFYIIGALAGGAVAGAWSINWVPQGVGVGIGVFTVPIILYIAFPPEHPMSTVIFLAVICATTVLAVVGAFIGHKVIRPFRYIVS